MLRRALSEFSTHFLTLAASKAAAGSTHAVSMGIPQSGRIEGVEPFQITTQPTPLQAKILDCLGVSLTRSQ